MDLNDILFKQPVRLSLWAVLIAALAAPLQSLYAGGYVNGTIALDPATSGSSGGTVSVTPTYNNAQFTNKVLVATVNNNPVTTPSTNDPVSTVSGNNYHDETDFQIKGRNGLNYVFTRTYNSGQSAVSTDSGLGYGWSHSYGMKLVSNDFGLNPNATVAANSDGVTSSITYTDERGGQENFLVNATTNPPCNNVVPGNTITNPCGVFDTLTLNSAAGQHTLTFRNGVKYTFEVPSGNLAVTPNVTARLKTISNPWGDQLTLNYDSQGRLSTITDNLGIAGRTGLTFHYNGTDTHIQNITDWTNRKWQYVVTSGYLTAYANPLTYANVYGYTPEYYYSSTQNPTGYKLLQTVTKPAQRGTDNLGYPIYATTTFWYYQNGRVFEDYDTLNNSEILDYDLYRMSTRVTDPRGGIRQYNYDTNGFMTKLTEADGGVLFFASQSDGLRYQKYDALGYGTQYSYNSANKSFNTASDNGGNVSREQDALGKTIDTAYGPYDQVASVKDKRGNILTTSYYSTTSGCAFAGKPQAVTISSLNGTANVKLRDYCWNSNGTLNYQNEYLDAAGAHKRTTTYTYDPASNGLNVSDVTVTATNTPNPANIHTHYIYDTLGRKTSETLYRATSISNPALEALTTTYTYDPLDRAIQVKNPNGRIQETLYDANGQVLEENTWYPGLSNRNGCWNLTINTVSYTICSEAIHFYDAADRRYATQDILGNTSYYGYDKAGNLTSQTDANGHTTKYEYDAMNRKTAVIDANGRRTQTSYNQRGDAISVTNDNGETVKSQYDALGRLTQVTDNLNFATQYKYDANGNQLCIIDANEHSVTTDPSYQPLNSQGCTVYNSYDELNRLTQSMDAQGNITAYAYDLLGNRTTVTDANVHVTTFTYNDLGLLVSKTDPLNNATGSTESYVNDEAGNVIQITDRKGQISQHFYDAMNRKTQSNWADGTQDSNTYDNFDDLRQVQNNAVTYSYAYDNKHRLQSKTDSRQGISLSWTFDKASNIHTKTDYQGNVTTYQYDNSNRLVAETNPHYLEVSYHYDDAGRLLDRILSNGARSHYIYDGGGRLTRLTNTTATNGVVNDTQYTRDHIGNILTAIESAGTSQLAGTSTFKYDPEYRLTAATYPATANNESITYDAVGNRKTYAKGSQTLYYNVNAANRLIDRRTGSYTGTVYESYIYDKNGSMTSIGGARTIGMTWDAHNRISQMQVNSIPAYSYQYDPSGYRIQKNAGSTKNYYLQAENLEAIYDNNNVLLGQFFRGSVIDEVVNSFQQDSTGKMVNYTYHHDALESVLGQSGHDGTILAAQGYTSFGSTINATGSSNNMLKYTGREQDSETGCYYYRARYYCGDLGFISEDPKGFSGGSINLYTLCLNNPVNCSDPSGLVGLADYINAGIRVLNKALDVHPVTGIPFKDGFPDFSSVAIKTVQVTNLTGNRSVDAKLANAAAELDAVPTGFTWHHVEDGTTMQLVPDGIHNDTAHTGGAAWLKAGGVAAGSVAAEDVAASDGITWNDVGNGIKNILSDPSTYLWWINSGDVGAGSDVVPSNVGSSADGGFVIYPNKSNTNQMRSVYKK